VGYEDQNMMMMGMKCRKCGSTEVGADLSSAWDAAEQVWDASGDLDARMCHECGDDELESYELRGKALADALHDRRVAGIEELMHGLQRALKEGGAIGHLVIPELIEQASAIRSKLYSYAATMAQYDELVDALALTIPYAETRAEDLALASSTEDKDAPGHVEAASAVTYAERVLIEHGAEPYLLERGQRAGVQP
jgi:hypothetical protein